MVVIDTTKVRFFKQITTVCRAGCAWCRLLLTPQRYDFSSKSQLLIDHISKFEVVIDTTKVRFFKQITTKIKASQAAKALLLTPQRYDFSSKSQRFLIGMTAIYRCY